MSNKCIHSYLSPVISKIMWEKARNPKRNPVDCPKVPSWFKFFDKIATRKVTFQAFQNRIYTRIIGPYHQCQKVIEHYYYYIIIIVISQRRAFIGQKNVDEREKYSRHLAIPLATLMALTETEIPDPKGSCHRVGDKQWRRTCG